MRCYAYGVLGRIFFPCMRVTPESARHATFRFSATGQSFGARSSAFDSGSPEMPSCQVSTQATSYLGSCLCYREVARTWLRRSATALSVATAFSGGGDSGDKVLVVRVVLTALVPRNRTVLQLVLVDCGLV